MNIVSQDNCIDLDSVYMEGGFEMRLCAICRQPGMMQGVCVDCLDKKRREYLLNPEFRDCSYMTRAEAKEFCSPREFARVKCVVEGCEGTPMMSNGKSRGDRCQACAQRRRRRMR